MTKELMIAQLSQGNTGDEILSILDVLCTGLDNSESSSITELDEI
jgi:hypothetical protein